MMITSVMAAGVAFTGSTAADAPPDSPTTDPGNLQVSLLNESNDANVTFGVNTTSKTINKTNATDSDVAVGSVNSDLDNTAKAIQFAIDNATTEYSTVRVGSGIYNGSVSIDVNDLTLEGADGASSTIIGQSSVAVTSTTPNVEIADLRIQNPDGSRAVMVTDDATDVVIQDNTITNINTDNDATQPRGILVIGLDGGDSADGLEIRNNTVTNIESNGGDQAHGIQILEESNGGGLIENVVVDGNTIEDISDIRSTVAVNFNGHIEGEITNNDISGLNTEGNPTNASPGAGFTQVIALNAGGNAVDGPQNVTIEGNDISDIETTEPEEAINFAPPFHIIIGSDADADTISIENNDFSADSVDPRGDVYIGSDGTGDFDLQGALGANTFTPSAVQGAAGGNRILVPETGVDVVNVDQNTGFDQIQPAVDGANPGDTIEVKSGTYNDSVTINVTGLTLEGPNAGTAGNNSNGRGPEATIQQGVQILSDNVTLTGFDVTNDDTNGILLGTNTAPSNVTISDTVVRDISGGTGGDKSAGNGVNLQFNGAVNETSTDVVITDNLIINVTTQGDNSDEDAIGIQTLPRGNDVEDLQITDNVISDIEPADNDGRSEARGISIDTQFENTSNGDRGNFGQATNLTVKNNDIDSLTADFARAITLFEDKQGPNSGSTSGQPVGPVNFTITENRVTGVNSEGTNGNDFRDIALFVGASQTLGPDHSVSANTFASGAVVRFADTSQAGEEFDPDSADALDTSGNKFTNDSIRFYYSDATAEADLTAVRNENTFSRNVIANDTLIFPSASVNPAASVTTSSVAAGDQSVTADINFSRTAGGNVTLDVQDSSDNSITDQLTSTSSNGTVTVDLSRSVSGEDIDVVVFETDDTAVELDRATVTVPSPPDPDPANFGVSLSTPDTVTAGETVTATATAENTGEQSGSKSISFSVDGEQADSTSVSLDGGASQAVSFSYDTTANDTPSVTLQVASDDDTASSTVSVSAPAAAAFDITTVDTPETVTAGDTVEVAATVENTGEQSRSQSITLDVGGTQVDSTSVSLDGGASQEITLTYTTTTDDAPAVELTVASDTDSTTRSVSVTEPAVSSFTVASIDTPDTVTAGEEIAVSTTIENTGSESGTQPVSLLVDGSEETSRSVTLAAGEQTTESFGYSVASSATTQQLNIAVETANDTTTSQVQVSGALNRTPLRLQANETAVVRGETVEFTVTDPTGSPVDASVRVLDTTQQTDDDGTTTIPIETVGRLDAVATKTATNTTEFAPASISITASAPALRVDRQTVSFGDVAVGDTATVEVTVSNPSPTRLDVGSLRVTGPGASAVTLDQDAVSESIPANGDRTLEVAFTPQSRGTISPTLSVDDQTVSISGTGTQPELNIDTELPIELTTAPDSSATTAVTLSNDGNAPVTTQLTSGESFTQPDAVTVAAGGTETFDIEFAPQASDTSTISTQLTLTPANETLSSTTIPVVGTITDREVTARTTAVSFDAVPVNETQRTGVVVDNTGTTTETLTATTDTDAFELGDDDREFTLAPDTQAFLSVAATPAESGDISGSLSIESTDGELSDSVSLSVTGQAPELSVDASDPLSFGPTPQGSTATQVIDISNPGDGTLSVRVDQQLSETAFAVPIDRSLSVPTGESRRLPIRFTPQTAGQATAELPLVTNDPEAPQRSITLQGDGVATDVRLSTGQLEFGIVGVGNATTETLTIANNGSSFTISDVSVEGTAYETTTNLAGTTLENGDATEVGVRFEPEVGGTQTGTLTVSGSTDTDSTTLSAALTGSGQTADLRVGAQTLRTGVTTTDGQTTGSVIIENTGPAGSQLSIDDVELTDTEQFSLRSDGVTEGTVISGQSEATLPVTFTPAATGSSVRETELTIDASSGQESFTRTLDVAGTVTSPDPTVSTDELAVGEIPTGETTRRTITVSNDGGEPFSITAVDAGASGVRAEQVGSGEIVAGEERTIAVVVNRSVGGSFDTTVDISTTTEETLTTSLTGTIATPTFALASESVSFEDTPTRSATQRSVDIENTGDVPLVVTAPTIEGSNADAFSLLSGDRELRIAAGSSETVTVGFNPTTAGDKTAILSIRPRNDPAVETTQQLALSGRATESDVGLTNPAVSFGALNPETTQTRSVSFVNDGTAPVEITGASVTGTDSGAVAVDGLQQQRVQPGETTSFGITVDTANRERGTLAAQVAIATTGETVTAPVSATVASPELTISPSTGATVSTVRIGETTTTNIQVANDGNAPLEVTAVSTTGGDAAAFNVVNRPTGSISSGSSDRATIEFDPAALPNAATRAQGTPLDASTSLEVITATGERRSISLSGTAETGALTTPRTFQFGTTTIGETRTQSFTIANSPSATTPVDITGVSISGRDAGAYDITLSDSDLPRTLAPGESATANVRLTPASPGQKFATLTVQTADPRQSVSKVGLSNTDTVYAVEYGSIDVQYINPTPGQSLAINVDQGLRAANATLVSTSSVVNTSDDYAVNYTFGVTPSAVGADASLQEAREGEVAVQYLDATTTAQPAQFDESTLQIEVSKTAIAAQNASPENVTVYRENDGRYEPIDTTLLFETTRGYVYEVTTGSYSVFVVGVTDETTDGETGGVDDGDGDTGGVDDGDEDTGGVDDGDGDTGGVDDGGGGGGGDGDIGGGGNGGGGGFFGPARQATEIATETEAISGRQVSLTGLANRNDQVRAITLEFSTPTFQEVTADVFADAPEGYPTQRATSVSAVDITVPESVRGEPATVIISLNRDHVQEVGPAPEDLQIERFTGSQYQPLSTEVVSVDSEEVTLRAETPGFSLFIISAPVSGAVTTTPTLTPTPSSTVTQTVTSEPPTPTPDPTPTPETPTSTPSVIPGFGLIVALVAIISLTMILRYRRRQ
ncbi:probable secreted glycoprotein Hmu2 [Haloquadratum walsbyi DSM 16790]|uniref:Probable secreted glycoprotein Hmu2 n=2 Tax=Haloquadratum walsbyi TaxID=293091 RepID=Q18DY9_HALWD|nr:probable secreted glycoprotein Hmu2 [Haloquadratum walsbyi DSM 16790]